MKNFVIYAGILMIGESRSPRCTGHMDTIGDTRHLYRILAGTSIGECTSEGSRHGDGMPTLRSMLRGRGGRL
jgi:hypothetical protein